MNKFDTMMKDLEIEIKTQEMKLDENRKKKDYNNGLRFNYNLGVLDGLKKAYRIAKYSSI